MEKELEEIADFISGRIDTLMPKLHATMIGSQAWPLARTAGMYFAHWRTMRMEGQDGDVAHQYALSQLLQDEAVGAMLTNLAKAKIDGMAGVKDE
jgi:hypothetical protein